MSDEEYIKFEITDHDIENEFNSRGSRRPTKNQQIYGIWARDEDSDEDDGGGRPAFGAGGRRSKNYSAPIGFVAGGVQQAGKDKDKAAKEKANEDDNDEGEGGSSRRKFSDSSDDEPSTSGRPSFKTKDYDEGGPEEIAGLRRKSFKHNPALAQRGVGTWEKHTKGIGAKLLLQMGFQPGKGLGKDLQGIQAPIEAHLRKGRGAIGAYGPEKAAKVSETKDDKKDSKDKSIEKTGQWRKGADGSRKQKARYFYKTIEDVLDQNIQPQRKREFSELTKVKVIDMTGPEQRVLSGYHAISGNQRPSDDWEGARRDKKYNNFSMPELQHNLNLLVDMCEQDIVAKDRQLKYNEDRIVGLEAEYDNLKKLTDTEATTISGLEHMLSVLERLTSGVNDGSVTLGDLVTSFKELQKQHPTEYTLYNLAAVAPALARPLLKDLLSNWEPLINPEEPVRFFMEWRQLLGEISMVHALSSANLQDPFHRLLWDAWMPCVRKGVNSWNVKDPQPLLDLLDVWRPLMPSWILDNILQQLVMPRLQTTTDEWNPLTDTVPVHTWTHPWVPLLGKRLKVNVFPVLRQKLASALTSWHPSDSSARLLLMPWASVFSRVEMDTFLTNNIIPKLNLVLQELVINPSQQTLDSWNWVMDWKDLIPPNLMADILHKSFLPRWLQVLTMWLNMAPNFDQVAKWYSGWKSIIPANVREEATVKETLRTALELMSRAVGGPAAPTPPPPPAPPIITAPPAPIISDSSGRFQGLAQSVRTASQMVEGFKDLVQKRCEERGILFHPMANRTREGKQMYRCGNVHLYIDRNVIFYNDPKTNDWTPISLQSLIEKATGAM